jgi:ABC-2 type transport system permease protein
VAVYKRTYTGYEGALTPDWSRFLVLPRASYARVSGSRLLMLLRIVAWFWPVGNAVYIYLANNLDILGGLGLPIGQGAQSFFTIDSGLFLLFCWVQGAFAYLITALVGPTLVSPDLVNNALPLYLSRPFSRTEYVLGKMSLLILLLSVVTWIPGLILFIFQAVLAGSDWTSTYWRVGVGMVIGQFLWIVLLSLIALAVSAWVKWRIAAGALLLGIFVVGAGFGGVINQIVRTDYGSLFNLPLVMYTIWMQLFGRPSDTGLEPLEAWLAVAAFSAGCLYLLWRKVRAFEVVK